MAKFWVTNDFKMAKDQLPEIIRFGVNLVMPRELRPNQLAGPWPARIVCRPLYQRFGWFVFGRCGRPVFPLCSSAGK